MDNDVLVVVGLGLVMLLGLFGTLAPFLPGLPLIWGAVAGVLLAEQRLTGDWNAAWASTKGAVVGFGIGALIEIGAGLAMIATWIVWVIAG